MHPSLTGGWVSDPESTGLEVQQVGTGFRGDGGIAEVPLFLLPDRKLGVVVLKRQMKVRAPYSNPATSGVAFRSGIHSLGQDLKVHSLLRARLLKRQSQMGSQDLKLV